VKPVAAHVACIVLLGLDVGSRTVRLWLLLRGLRCDVPLVHVAASIGASDAAAAITPMRLGGGPTQIAVLARAGVPVARGASALGLEAVATYPAALLVGAWLAVRGGGSWRRAVAPLVPRAPARLTAIVALLLALSVLLLWGARRLRRRLPATTGAMARPNVREELVLMARLPPGIAVAAVALGAVHVVARVAMLPVLTRALPAPPPLDVAALGSYALIYGQLVAPTPSGAGLVEYLGARGVAGSFGTHAVWVLGWWRAYATFGGVLALVPAAYGRLRLRGPTQPVA